MNYRELALRGILVVSCMTAAIGGNGATALPMVTGDNGSRSGKFILGAEGEICIETPGFSFGDSAPNVDDLVAAGEARSKAVAVPKGRIVSKRVSLPHKAKGKGAYFKVMFNARCYIAADASRGFQGVFFYGRNGNDIGPTGADAMVRVAKTARDRLGCEVLLVNMPLSRDYRPHADGDSAGVVPLPAMPFSARWLDALVGGRFEYDKLRTLGEREEMQWWDATTPCYTWLFGSGLPYMWYSRDAVHSGEYGKQIIGRVMLGYLLSSSSCPQEDAR